MRKRFKGPLYLIFFLIICAIILDSSYIVYKKYFKESSEIITDGALSINYKNGSKLNIKNKKDTSISVINSSEEMAYYYIEFRNLKNIKEKIQYNLIGDNDLHISDVLNKYNTIISSYIPIEAGGIHNYKLSFESKKNVQYGLDIIIKLDSLETDNFAEMILKNNEIKNKSLTVPGVEIATADEGLIQDTDDYGTTYYFRGDVNNNNVKLGDRNFKIVRINGDGSVRLVLDGTAEESQIYNQNITDYSFGSSNTKNYLESWIKNNLSEYDKYLATHKFCNDTNLDNDIFTASTRIENNHIPSYVCLGNKISSKVGLLTADEVLYAGGAISQENTNYYLYNSDIKNDSFLITSAKLSGEKYYPYSLTKNGSISSNLLGSNPNMLRPVINIIKTSTVSGDGTIENPYILTN